MFSIIYFQAQWHFCLCRWLLGYPVVYVFTESRASWAGQCVGSDTLHLYRVLVNRCEGLKLKNCLGRQSSNRFFWNHFFVLPRWCFSPILCGFHHYFHNDSDVKFSGCTVLYSQPWHLKAVVGRCMTRMTFWGQWDFVLSWLAYGGFSFFVSLFRFACMMHPTSPLLWVSLQVDDLVCRPALF